MDKRGVSPLIATFVLIIFSVVLGAVVMSYGQSYVEEQATFVSGAPEVGERCDQIDLQVIKVKDAPQICVRDQVVELAIDNGPNLGIDAIQARVVGDNDVSISPNILNSPLAAASSLKTAFTFTDVGKPLQVKLTPVITTTKGQEFCSERAVVVEDLRDC